MPYATYNLASVRLRSGLITVLASSAADGGFYTRSDQDIFFPLSWKSVIAE
jgi:hypothetical protein